MRPDQRRVAAAHAVFSAVDQRVLDAATAVLGEWGWDGLNLERVAERAGLSRVTLWRQGVSKEGLVDGLLLRLTADYRDSMFTVLASAGSGAARLCQALEALCGVADRHLELLLASDVAFHEAQERADPRPSFIEPLVRLLHDGVADGTLRPPPTSFEDFANTIFNTVCWSYVHLHGRHDWPPDQARSLVLDLVLNGLSSRTTAPKRASAGDRSGRPKAT
jgi:AcrR family transcriptional regulator